VRIDDLFIRAPLLAKALTMPLLEVTVPVHFPDSERLLGIARYWVDGQAVYDEYLKLDRHLVKQFIVLSLGGGCLILVVLFWSFYRLFHTNRLLEQRSLGLRRANQELNLFAKTSAVGAITAHLIHGLRNPIMGLQEFLALQRSSGQSNVDDADWETAHLTIQRMHSFVQELVTLLQEEHRKDHYNVTSQEIHQVIATKFQEEAATKHIDMEISRPPDFTLPNRKANCLLLILGNLIKNAVEATPSRKKIRISFQLEDHKLTIQIRDEGPGLPQDLRNDPFRPHISTKQNGSGIGLAISYQLARHIQADLKLLHTGKKGTEFGLEVPIDDTEGRPFS
jgi:signal transduction histidine kinase